MRNLRLYIWILAAIPLTYLSYALFLAQTFPNDPIKLISDVTGLTALEFLTATLWVTPLRVYLKINLIKYRRLLGLFTFFYAFLHMLLYLILDHEGDFLALFKEALDKKFIFFGMASLLILLFMVATSTKKLFKRFVKWHQLIYLVAIFIAFHYYLSQKVVGIIVYIYITELVILLLLRKDKLVKLYSLFVPCKTKAP